MSFFLPVLDEYLVWYEYLLHAAQSEKEILPPYLEAMSQKLPNNVDLADDFLNLKSVPFFRPSWISTSEIRADMLRLFWRLGTASSKFLRLILIAITDFHSSEITVLRRWHKHRIELKFMTCIQHICSTVRSYAYISFCMNACELGNHRHQIFLHNITSMPFIDIYHLQLTKFDVVSFDPCSMQI